MAWFDLLIFAAIFVAILIVVGPLARFLVRITSKDTLDTDQIGKSDQEIEQNEILALSEDFVVDLEHFNHYFRITANPDSDRLALKLLRCGFLSIHAKRNFNIFRVAMMLLAGSITFTTMMNGQPLSYWQIAGFVSVMVGGFTFILTSVALDKLEKSKERQYRALIPDLLDLLIVCVDAGISIEAAFKRIGQEFALTNSDFAFHLVILTLEVRAGRPLHEAIYRLSERLRVEEVRSLAILFRQSERLGASVGKTLRVFAEEMRRKRLLAAEEKANALPVKMLFPMTVFIFPVNLLIVLVPVMLSLMKLFTQVGPGG